MKNYIYILLLFSSTACGSNQESNKSIDIFNGSTFELIENEKEITITSHTKDDYLDIIKGKNLQIPLFKSVKGSRYYILIGLPVKTTLTEMLTSSLYNDSLKIESKSDSFSFVYQKYKYEERYISEFISKNQGNIIYTLAITESKTISDSLFNYKELSNRIHLKSNE